MFQVLDFSVSGLSAAAVGAAVEMMTPAVTCALPHHLELRPEKNNSSQFSERQGVFFSNYS